MTAGRYQAYPEYKDSGVEWLGMIPAHWKLFRLKYSVELINKKMESAMSNASYTGLEHIESWTGNRILSYDTPVSEGQANLYRQGDVLFGKLRPYLAKVHAANKDGICTSELLVLRPISVKQKFLMNYLLNRSFVDTVDSSTYGAKMPRASWDFIGNLPAFIPPPNEQQTIAAFLDHETAKIDTLIQKQQKLITLLKEKRQAVISHAVTKGLNPDAPMKDSGVEWLGVVPGHWRIAKLRRSLLEHKQGYYTTAQYVDDGIKLLRITDLKDHGGVDITDCPMVPRTDTSLSNYELIEGDVVFARTGGAGTFGVIGELKEDVVFASYLIRFRFNSEYVLHNYIKFQLLADSFQMSIKQNIHGGVNQNIHAEDIKNAYLTWPSINEQQQIAAFLGHETTKIDTLINKAQRSIELSKERRTALISAAVTGKIDVRNWQSPPTHRETQ